MGCSNSIPEDKKRDSRTDFKSFGIESGRIDMAGDVKTDNNKLVNSRIRLANEDRISHYYEVKCRIGSGAFSKVYKVVQIHSLQERAMKVIKLDSLNYQDDNQNFLREIDILSQLDHPNIIKIYEYFQDDINYYVITEYARGGELYEKIFTIQNFNETDTKTLMKQLFSAVNYFHGKGIVHRDLKPENILLDTTEDGDLDIKLIDFGTANYWNTKHNLTLNIGTPYYIAPEILSKKYNNKCDIWSCGVIMYVLLSGSPPFTGKDEQEIIKKVCIGKYSLSDPKWDKISDEAKDLISQLLNLDPEARFSADEALKHKWFVERKRTGKLTTKKNIQKLEKFNPFNNIRKFTQKQKFQEAVINFLVHNVNINEMNKKLSRIFKELDVNGDGILSYEEIKKGFQYYFGEDKNIEKEFSELIKIIDKDNSGSIEYNEFIRSTCDLNLLLTDQNLKMAFKAFDKDGSGGLAKHEIKEILGFEEEADNELILNILEEIDFNGDGTISYAEFSELMKKIINE